MKNLPRNLPLPSKEMMEHSQKLQNIIRTEIAHQGGRIPFSRFMELALYAPGLGYYSAGSHKFGAEGDFVTAPVISALFSQCLARQCCQVLSAMDNPIIMERSKGGGNLPPPFGDGPIIMELGAGNGKMAADLLLTLETENCLPENYFILETSADLRERQQIFLQQQIPHLFSKIKWLDQLPDQPLNGIILANEVLDAMPVHRFHLEAGKIQEWYVGCKENEFVWELDVPTQALSSVSSEYQLDEGNVYDSEVNALLPEFIKSLSQCLRKGVILLCDYGFPQHEYYHLDRSMGTLMCHYRHYAHSDPLILTGLQDITAHVNFTAVAEAAVNNDLQVAGFTNQAAFLLNCGLLELVKNENNDIKKQLEISRQIQILTSPAEMGELFKVIALTRQCDEMTLLGFINNDQRGRL